MDSLAIAPRPSPQSRNSFHSPTLSHSPIAPAHKTVFPVKTEIQYTDRGVAALTR